jgi:hypothetical protein
MSPHRTADEVKQHCLDSMGEELGRFYHELSNELDWLYIKWSEYVELYGTRPARVEMLNKAAGGFFRVVQDALLDDVLLHIACLTDPSMSAGRRNLTVRGVPDLIDRPMLRRSIEKRIDAAVQCANFARDWRNRRIAHRDLALALEQGAEPLMPASRAKCKKAIQAITEVLNKVSSAYLGSTTVFDSLENSAGAISLLYVIDDGLRVEDEREARFRSKDYRPDDYQRRDL